MKKKLAMEVHINKFYFSPSAFCLYPALMHIRRVNETNEKTFLHLFVIII